MVSKIELSIISKVFMSTFSSFDSNQRLSLQLLFVINENHKVSIDNPNLNGLKLEEMGLPVT